MGSKVNPAFISAFNNLKSARARYNALKMLNPNSPELRNAERDFLKAEAPFCNVDGIIEDPSPNALTKDQALGQVHSMMNEVKTWYA